MTSSNCQLIVLVLIPSLVRDRDVRWSVQPDLSD